MTMKIEAVDVYLDEVSKFAAEKPDTSIPLWLHCATMRLILATCMEIRGVAAIASPELQPQPSVTSEPTTLIKVSAGSRQALPVEELTQRRRGRPPLTDEQREAHARKMKEVWARRRERGAAVNGAGFLGRGTGGPVPADEGRSDPSGHRPEDVSTDQGDRVETELEDSEQRDDG